MGVADEDINLFKRLEERRRNPADLRQRPSFALPVVEDQQCSAHLDRKAAVIVVDDFELPVHRKRRLP